MQHDQQMLGRKQARKSAGSAAWRMGMAASVMAAALGTTACQAILGIEDTTQVSGDANPGMDAPPKLFTVRGKAGGIREPISLQLDITGVDEVLTITADGDFAFETQLEDGDSYTVSLMDQQPPCILDRAVGVIADTDPEIMLACHGAATLEGLSLSGLAPALEEFMPRRLDYMVDVPLFQQDIMVTATTNNPDTKIRIGGVEVASATPSPPVALALDHNLIMIEASHPRSGVRIIYRVDVRRAPELKQFTYGKASNTDAQDQFARSLAIDGDTLAVGAIFESSNATGVNRDQTSNDAAQSGAVYVFRRTGTTWMQEAYIKASNTAVGDEFGASVALDGNTLVVGAPFEDSNARGVNGSQSDNSIESSGAAYVFTRTGTTWTQEAYIKASNTDVGDNFGINLALSGNTLAVAAVYEDSAATGVDGDETSNAASNSGAIYVFQRTGTTWAQEAYLKASNTGVGDQLGLALALDGDVLAAGTPFEDSAGKGPGGIQNDDNAAQSGAVYIFRRSQGSWSQELYLKASNTDANDGFGASVALEGDVLVVGAPFESSAATGVGGNQDSDSAPQAGAVYVFRKPPSLPWVQDVYLKASNTGAGDLFGTSLALHGDFLAVGASYESSGSMGVNGPQNDDSVQGSGAVYFFQRRNSMWSQQAYLKASNTGEGDSFGNSLALSAETLVVGAQFESSTAKGFNGDQASDAAANSGAFYVFH